MNKIACGLFTGLTCALCWLHVRASDPPPARPANRVLLLNNERTVTGQIEAIGGRYTVRRDAGETIVPAATVLCLCDNYEEAYRFLRARANLNDADEHMRLARWCHLRGLRQLAIEEATAAVTIQPGNADCRRLLQACQRSPSTAAPDADIRVVSAEVSTDSTQKKAHAIEVSPELMSHFVTRVQPVLMNACVSCHSSGQSGDFALSRALERGVLNRRATQQNLGAVLSQINHTNWDQSPLLTKAVTPHGKVSEPPLKNRQAAAFRSLADWTRAVVTKSAPKFIPIGIQPLAEPPIEIGVPSTSSGAPQATSLEPNKSDPDKSDRDY